MTSDIEVPWRRESNYHEVCERPKVSNLFPIEHLAQKNLTKSDSDVDEINYDELVRSLKSSGQLLRSDVEQPKLLVKPDWFDKKLFENGQSIYSRHFMGANFAHLSGLLLLIRVDSIYDTLSRTGESSSVSKLFKRYYHTIKHVKSWYEGDIFEANSDAYRSLLIVRGMHNKASNKLNDNPHQQGSNYATETNESLIDRTESQQRLLASVHISQYDLMLTQFAFVGLIVISPERVGLLDDFNGRDMESILHFWRVIGYYLGISDKYNLCSYDFEVTKKLCLSIMNVEYKESFMRNKLNESSQGIMSINILRSVKFIPMLTVYGIMRYLNEIFEYNTSELEHRRTWYSNLSYTLIKLVMSNLLAYRPFRAFNNGLTRLSLFMIGKLEDWFANYLNKKYGQELKAYA